MSTADWRPIDTAPKDGSDIFVFVPDKGVYHVCWRGPLTIEGRLGWSIMHSRRSVLLEFPTYWMMAPEHPND